MDPLDILVISPGPDNSEISVGGTIAVPLRQKLHVGVPERSPGARPDAAGFAGERSGTGECAERGSHRC